MQDYLQRIEIESREEWDKWSQAIPFLSFPVEWEVRPTPPRTGAIVRLNVRLKERPEDTFVSIYLDCYEKLGFYDGQPYWEVYPYDGDVYRCHMNDPESLIAAIQHSLDAQ